jgi:hypothetical protein
MNNMQIQSLFDSVCRCFGHSPTNSPNGVEGVASAASQPMAEGASQSSVKRRTNRLELKDKQWDELFDKKKQQQQKHESTSTSADRRQSSSAAAAADPESENDLTIAHAVAQAKLAANPPRYTRSTSKRKRSAKSREEIFRSKHNAPPASSSTTETKASSTPFSRLIHPSLALCFATPIRGTEEEPEETDLRSLDNSDTNTLNTCEDTITSTVYFDNKLSHIEETRPPMPLFNQFKLVGHEKDEIRNIMETDSHSSLNMVRLLQQQQEQQQQQQRTQPGPLEESSSDSHEESRRNKQRRNTDHEMEDVPDVKAVSSSTDSSRQSHSHTLHEA